MKTVAPLSTVTVPRSPERVLTVARGVVHRTERQEVLGGDLEESLRVGRGAMCERTWVLRVPRGVQAVVTLEVIIERGAQFLGTVVLEGEGTCLVQRILRVVGPRVQADWVLRGSAARNAHFSEESWLFVAGASQDLALRTRLVLLDGAQFTGRHLAQSVAAGAAGSVVSTLDALRVSDGGRATVVPEVGVVPPALSVQHGARITGLSELQQEYLLAHAVPPEATRQALIDAFLYG